MRLLYHKGVPGQGQGRERVNQKRRTRAALVEAAQRLLDRGRMPTVVEVADEALVSRATAYRYFPSQEHLLLEVVLARSIDEIDPAVVAASSSDDVGARVDGLVRAVHDQVASNPAAFRTLLRLSLEQPRADGEATAATIRGERRLGWIEHALEPIRGELDQRSFRRLVSALALCTGTEAYVVLRDLCGLDDREAEETLRWAALALVTGGLKE
jgi:AcrR family transcriptional regulator